jgi:pre-mRNA-splicing factor ATP-dependent RNA helicase DHX16
MSDSVMVEYMIKTATTAPSPGSLLSSLMSVGLSSSPEAEYFVSELFKRVPRASSSSNTASSKKQSQENNRKKAEMEAKALQKQKFGLLMDDAPDDSKVEMKKGKKEKGTLKSKTTNAKDGWESDEEERAAKRKRWAEGTQRRENEDEDQTREPSETEAARIERERLQDARERDEFAERLKAKDRDKTKKIVEDKTSKLTPDQIRRRNLENDEEARKMAMPEVRKRARQEYLSKRELQQIELLKQEIMDEEADFKGVVMTQREIRELNKKKEVLRLAQERMGIDDGYQGYMMPEGNHHLSLSMTSA